MTDKDILLQFSQSLVPELQAVSGRFAESIESEVTNESLTISASPFIRTLIDGRGPTSSGAPKGDPTLQEIILDWIKSKNISPYPDKKGNVPTIEQLSWKISKSIHIHGTLLYQRGGGNNIFDAIITEARIQNLMNLLGKNYQSQIISIVKNDRS